jgi:CRISPR-associated endonuclease Cas1/group II intron reverse transcriptase/maturase
MLNPNQQLPTYSHLLDINILRRACQKVISKGSKGGIDHVSVVDFADGAESEIRIIHEELSAKRYVPEPYMEVKVPKKDNEFRSLGLLTIRDKIVQQALTDILTPYFEPQFLDYSYAYRQGRSTPQAVKRVLLCIEKFNNRWLARCDIDRFFDNIPHDLLEKQVRYFLKDESLIDLIFLCVGMGKVGSAGQNWQSSEGKGIPQGGILSPLLANLYLHQLDVYIRSLRRPMGYIRYADDFVLLTNDKNQAEAIGKRVSDYLTQRLGLKLDEFEVKSVEEGFTFLGMHFNTEGVGLDEDKRKEMLEKQENLIQFNIAEGINPKFKEFADGIHRYQSQVLSSEALQFFDENAVRIAIEKIKQLKIIEKELTLKQIRSWLEKLTFLSPQYRNDKNRIINEAMSVIKGEKNEISKTTPIQKGKLKKDETSTEDILKQTFTPQPLTTETLEAGINIPIEINPQKLIAKKQREYEQRESSSMELLVTHPGVILGLTKRQITARANGINLIKNPTANVRHISILSRGVIISSNLIWHCTEKNIPIVFHGDDGKPYAKVYSTDDADAELWFAQSEARKNGKGALIAREIAEAKVNNQINLLKYFSKHHKTADSNFQSDYQKSIDFMEKNLEKLQNMPLGLPSSELRQQIMAQEGNAAQSYWQQVRHLVADETDFQNREHQGAKDLMNMLLNYGYGILYGRVWSAVLNARLHPAVSFLHEPQTNKPTLVFDLVEEFRAPIVDRTIIALINRGEKLTIEQGKLTMETRKRLAEKVLERINTIENFRGNRIRLSEVMRLQTVKLAKFLRGEEKTYKPYLMKW